MYKVINNLSPGIIKDIFQKREISTLRIETNTFIRPNVDTVYKEEDYLRNFWPIVWNKSLPNNFKSAYNLYLKKYKIMAGTKKLSFKTI